MAWDRDSIIAVWVLVVTFGCSVSPPPVPIYDEPSLLVDVAYDPHAGADHSHPATISADQLELLLKGLRLQGRDVVGTGGYLDKERTVPAFADREVKVLAPFLARGLSQASPRDLVRFYLVQRDPSGAPLITSGGLFLHQRHLYMILANGKTSPSAVQYETTYEPNSRLDPLLPIARFKFKTDFVPPEWRIATHQAKRADEWAGYLDESKVVVVDLDRITPIAGTPPMPASR